MITPLIHRVLTREDLARLVAEIGRLDQGEARAAEQAVQAGEVDAVLDSPAARDAAGRGPRHAARLRDVRRAGVGALGADLQYPRPWRALMDPRGRRGRSTAGSPGRSAARLSGPRRTQPRKPVGSIPRKTQLG